MGTYLTLFKETMRSLKMSKKGGFESFYKNNWFGLELVMWEQPFSTSDR